MLVLLEAVVIAVCLVVPGYALLSRFVFRERWAGLSRPARLAYAWTASTAILSALQALHFVAPALLVRNLDWAALVVCLGLLAWKRRVAQEFLWPGSPGDLARVALGVAIALVAIVSLTHSVYPGPLSADYGDLPAYYRVASNLSTQSRPLLDFHPGDYSGAIYDLPVKFPVPVLVSSFFMTFFSSHSHVVELFGILSGVVLLGYGLQTLAAARSAPVFLALGLAFLSLSGFASHFFFGSLALPAGLFLLVLWRSIRVPALAATAALLAVGTRPEGVIFLVCLVAARVVIAALEALARLPALQEKRGARVAAVTMAALVLAMLGWQVVGLVPPSRDLSIAYHIHEPATGEFRLRYPTIYSVSADIIRDSVGIAHDDKFNPGIMSEVRAHPLDFAWWAGRVLYYKLASPEFVLLPLVLLAAALAAWKGRVSRLTYALAVVLFYVALLCVNAGFSARHTLPIAFLAFLVVAGTALDALGEERASSLWVSRACALGAAVLALLVVGAAKDAVVERRKPGNASFAPVLKAIEGQVKPGMVVATSYPQLISHWLGVEAVGNGLLGENVNEVAAKYRPDLILLDDARIWQKNYKAIADKLVGGASPILGYKMLIHDPQLRYALFSRQ